MGFGSIVGGLGGMIGTAFGGEANKAATQASAQTNADIQRMNTALQAELYSDQVARNQPYLDFGYTGAEGLSQGQGYDFRTTPEYQYRQGLGNQAIAGLQGFSPDVMGYAGGQVGSNLDRTEQDNAYNRLIDRVKIGQGQAASAGQSALGYGNAMTGVAQNVGNMNYLTQIQQQQGQNAMMGSLLGQASSIPAYMTYSNYAQNNYGQPQQTIAPRNFTGGDQSYTLSAGAQLDALRNR